MYWVVKFNSKKCNGFLGECEEPTIGKFYVFYSTHAQAIKFESKTSAQNFLDELIKNQQLSAVCNGYCKVQRGENMDIKEIENIIRGVEADILHGNIKAPTITDSDIDECTMTTKKLEDFKHALAFRDGYLSALRAVIQLISTGEFEEISWDKKGERG